MSLILKGIDMPKTEYEEVIIRIKHTGEVCDAQNIHLYAQATEILTPHGRLIDADALDLEREVDLADDWKTAHEIANCVKYAPTILEAEE